MDREKVKRYADLKDFVESGDEIDGFDNYDRLLKDHLAKSGLRLSTEGGMLNLSDADKVVEKMVAEIPKTDKIGDRISNYTLLGIDVGSDSKSVSVNVKYKDSKIVEIAMIDEIKAEA